MLRSDQTQEIRQNINKIVDITIVNHLDKNVSVFWNNPMPNESDISFGYIEPGKEINLDSYLDHTWIIRDIATDAILQEFIVNGDNEIFYVHNQPKTEAINMILKKRQDKFENNYMKLYGKKWLSTFPRVLRTFPILKAPYNGALQKIKTTCNFWDDSDPNIISKQVINFKLEVISQEPKIFIIEKFIHDDEITHFLSLSKDFMDTSNKSLFVCNTDLIASKVLENIVDRIADVLRIPRLVLKRQSGEGFQIIKLIKGGGIKKKSDFLLPSSYEYEQLIAQGNNCFATIILILKNCVSGGEEIFPLSTAKKGGIKLSIPKGTALIFYNMLQDGNLDEKSIHETQEVTEGIKIMANFWIWDRTYR